MRTAKAIAIGLAVALLLGLLVLLGDELINAPGIESNAINTTDGEQQDATACRRASGLADEASAKLGVRPFGPWPKR